MKIVLKFLYNCQLMNVLRIQNSYFQYESAAKNHGNKILCICFFIGENVFI